MDVTPAESPGSPSSARAAYVFGLFGNQCSPHLQASLLSGVETLVNARPLYPIVSMVGPVCATKRFLRDELRRMAITVVEIEELRDIPCRGSKVQGARLASTYTMSGVWSLTMYEVVMLLDSDLAVIRPLDDVISFMLSHQNYIEARTPLKCRTSLSTYQGDGQFNSGVWGLRPNRTIHSTFVDWLQGNKDGSRFPCGIGIQDAANNFFSRSKLGKQRRREGKILGLSVAYNLKVDTRSRRCMGVHNISERGVHVVHWSGPRKPQRIRANDLMREPVAVKIALLSYMSAYCRFLHLLNSSVATTTEACQEPRWTRFDNVALQSNLTWWVNALDLGPSHLLRRCASSAHLAACMGVPSLASKNYGKL